MLVTDPSLDIKSYLNGTCAESPLVEETDNTLLMTIKYATKTLYSVMDGFPILRTPSTLREKLNEIVRDNQPENMLLSS